jgi:hypothetical protein
MDVGGLYLDLMKGVLTRTFFMDEDYEEVLDRKEGRDWPTTAKTMIGHRRLEKLQAVMASSTNRCGSWKDGSMTLCRRHRSSGSP